MVNMRSLGKGRLERGRAILPRKPPASLPLKVRALRSGEELGFVVHVGLIETP